MYVPKHFAEPDIAACHGFIREYGFGLLIGVIDGAPFATHLPFLLDESRGARGTLMAHMARANPHWQGFAAGGRSLAIFQGPHAYVSPSWYTTKDKVVPTWNYAAVHAYGAPRIIEDEGASRAHLERLVAAQEAGRDPQWRLDSQPEDFIEALAKGVVAFEMPIETLEGKTKLSQNRPPEDRASVAAALAESDDPLAHAVAAMMTARDG